MGMGYAPTWFRQVSPPLLLHKTTLTTDHFDTQTTRKFNPRLDPRIFLRNPACC